jgi:hypothetical protein
MMSVAPMPSALHPADLPLAEALRAGCLNALTLPLLDARTLKLGHTGHDGEDELASGRGGVGVVQPPISVLAITIDGEVDGVNMGAAHHAPKFTRLHRHRVFKGAGHNPPQERPAEWVQRCWKRDVRHGVKFGMGTLQASGLGVRRHARPGSRRLVPSDFGPPA